MNPTNLNTRRSLRLRNLAGTAALTFCLGLAPQAFGANTIIDIVDGVVTPGPQRTANGSEHFLAWDGDVNTRTFSTNSGTQTVPQHTRLDFEGGGHLLGLVRINDQAGNDNNGRMQQISLSFTTDTDADLNARNYTAVTNLTLTQFTGDDPVGPNLNISGNTIEHLDVAHDGFYSVSFDPVPNATGIEFQWTNEGSFRHWTIRELEAYAVPEPSTALLGLLGLTLLARRRR